MSKEPVALLSVDSRGYGPFHCDSDRCEGQDVEEVILTSDGDFICPECGELIEELQGLSSVFMSAEHLNKK